MASTATESGGFSDEGGHQLKPELDLALDAQPSMDIDDLLVLDDEDDMPLQPQSRKLERRDGRDIGDTDQRMQRNARLAALDPDDGIAL